ncbi:hypothetical protein OS493_005850 [Desmophyllum pertusum]|uniref:Uncharacterized protein n=1 Tax=Desmophyllum pertusum TaxID=174260 RepID=A0A9W9YFH2_9CNID|nr:hypothetical protein OS493_005850 [Desmophyllum pertusum]
MPTTAHSSPPDADKGSFVPPMPTTAHSCLPMPTTAHSLPPDADNSSFETIYGVPETASPPPDKEAEPPDHPAYNSSPGSENQPVQVYQGVPVSKRWEHLVTCLRCQMRPRDNVTTSLANQLTPNESTIKTLFADIDALEKVTALLDLEEISWQRVGRMYGIDKRLLDSLKPDPIQSPTKVVMEYIVQKEPTLL